jgi:hypothetical protein
MKTATVRPAPGPTRGGRGGSGAPPSLRASADRAPKTEAGATPTPTVQGAGPHDADRVASGGVRPSNPAVTGPEPGTEGVTILYPDLRV